jgi:hypothetical protein
VTLSCKWFVARTELATEQRTAVEAIKKRGGFVTYSYELPTDHTLSPGSVPSGPAWLWKWRGVDFVSDVVAIDFVHEVTDADVVHVKGLTALKHLSVWGTGVTDSGLESVKELTGLEHLYLQQTGITDAGLVHLETLVNLRNLKVQGTDVTSEGVERLQQALPDCQITFEIRGQFRTSDEFAPAPN